VNRYESTNSLPTDFSLLGAHAGQPAVVIGNGRSRSGYDLTSLEVVTVGCNALYREFAPDYLIAQDLNMIIEIMSAGYADQHKVLVPGGDLRNALLKLDKWTEDYPKMVVLSRTFNNSGNTALYLALLMGCDPVYLLGFDGRVMTDDGEQNNIYYGTKNYTTSYCDPFIEAWPWTNGFERAVKDFPNRKVYAVESSFYPCENVSQSAFAAALARECQAAATVDH